MYNQSVMSKTSPHKQPQDATLSVIIPVYNAEQWMPDTLDRLWKSLSKSNWRRIEIIVVDDGSTDNTAKVVRGIKLDQKIKLVVQKNAGRFMARKKGLAVAKGDYVFFIDSRVFAGPGSFKYLATQMQKNPEAVIWNGHVEVDRQGNWYARFWHTVTFIAWRRYFKNPKLTHYGLADYDYYPKGTTCFLAPRQVFLDAYAQFKTGYQDLGNANDDSALIRYMVKQHDIYIAPQFSFTYHSRSTLKAFMKHTTHRGVVFIDGFLKPGTRYFVPLIIVLSVLPLALPILILFPWLIFVGLITYLSGLLVVLLLGVKLADAIAFIAVLPIFAVFYAVGLYKGLYLKFRNRNAVASS